MVYGWARNKNNIDEKTGHIRSHNYNGEFGFAEGITWTVVSTGTFAARFSKNGFLFDSAVAKAFINSYSKYNIYIFCSMLNSNVIQYYLELLNPTLNYKPGDLALLPVLKMENDKIENLTKYNIKISKLDWDSFETSWDFKKHPLI